MSKKTYEVTVWNIRDVNKTYLIDAVNETEAEGIAIINFMEILRCRNLSEIKRVKVKEYKPRKRK